MLIPKRKPQLGIQVPGSGENLACAQGSETEYSAPAIPSEQPLFPTLQGLILGPTGYISYLPS